MWGEGERGLFWSRICDVEVANAQVEEIQTAEEPPWVPLYPCARLAADSSWQGSWLQSLETVWKGWRKKRSFFPPWKASSALLDVGPAMFRGGKRLQLDSLLLRLGKLFDLSSRTDLGPLEQQSERAGSQVSCWFLASF